jgi:hypothetical protein
MKTTLDLPDDLVREMKLRAVMQGRTLRDLATEFMLIGLGLPPVVPRAVLPQASLVQLNARGLPVVQGHANASARRMSTQELLSIEQATLTQEDAQRAGLPV